LFFCAIGQVFFNGAQLAYIGEGKGIK